MLKHIIFLTACIAVGLIISGCHEHTTGKRRGFVAAVPTLAPIESLTCQQVGFTGTANVTWTLPIDTQYDELRIRFGADPVTVLPGDTTSYTGDFSGGSGDIQVCIEAVAGTDLIEICCTFVAVELPAITNLTCTPIGFSGRADVAWDLPDTAEYDEIQVRVDGELVATLPGDATTVGLLDLNPGSDVAVEIEGQVALGDVSASRFCDLEVPELAAVENLACDADGYAGRVNLSWALPDSEDHDDYDEIRIYLDDFEIAAIAATETNFEITDEVPGQEILVAVEGVIGDDRAASSCTITPPELPTVGDLACVPLDDLGTGQLSWALPLNAEGDPDTTLFDEIRIVSDDLVLVTLDGEATSVEISDQIPGLEVEFCIEGYVDADDIATRVCCTIDFPELAPVTDLECSEIGFNGRADLSWALPATAEYDEIAILVDDLETELLDPTATSYELGELEPGSVSEVCVVGRVGDADARVCCTVELPVLPIVDALDCAVGGEFLDEVTVSWTLPVVSVPIPGENVYDEIRIYVDDEADPREVLNADETSVTLTGFDREVSVEICVDGYLEDGERSARDCCEALLIPQLPQPDFRRGDIDQDSYTQIDDVIQILQTLDGELPTCLEAADIDNDGRFDAITDALYMLELVFLDLHEMPEPVACGADDDNALGCDSYSTCD